MNLDNRLDELCEQVRNMMRDKQKQDDALKAILDRVERMEYTREEVKK